jgi:hypothetical protein
LPTAKTPASKRAATPKRFRVAKADASIESIQRTIEKNFHLPAGSVKLTYRNGRKARIDATVGTLRANWKKNG